MTHPYAGLASHCFWKDAITRKETFLVDPVVSTRFKVSRDDKVATLGSCFAQHISSALQKAGFNYFCTEPAPAGMDEAQALARNFGVFSARYGNIYTPRQLLQLFHEAFGERKPTVNVWRRKDGRFVDPYRPQIEPDGFATADDVLEAREEHLAAVQRLFLEAEVLVFTLGLTQAWRSKEDGSVFPVAPGVAGGIFNPRQHEFHNFGVDEVRSDLTAFLDDLFGVNPTCRVLFTVSPVPLIATYEPEHVLTSTTYSKAVLRVAADEIVNTNVNVDYFPSYEIITGSYSRGRYFAPDLRTVTRHGVGHAMRTFMRHYTSAAEPRVRNAPAAALPKMPSQHELVCDEEMIELVRA